MAKETLLSSSLDHLTQAFNADVNYMVLNKEKQQEMLALLGDYNPRFKPVEIDCQYPETRVLANVVAGIYAPLIHGFTSMVLKNIDCGLLPGVIMAPPRDAIPLVTSLKAITAAKGLAYPMILMPPINRITAGIPNNQKLEFEAHKDRLFDLLVEQTFNHLNGYQGVTEMETGIYGTTSLVTAATLRKLGLNHYHALKFYGLGPNLSYIHGLLSSAQEWQAEIAEAKGLVDPSQIASLMVLLDTIEELGMEKFFQSVNALAMDADGQVIPVINPSSAKEVEVAYATNEVIKLTASQYLDQKPEEVKQLLTKIPWLVAKSQQGFPFTLKTSIPSMDSQEEHFTKIRESGLFAYPKLVL